ncbi:uridine kinase [Fulvivirgaceae bacterium LMO-SS25]
MTKPYIIGITGGSASGKTLFLNTLLKSFPNKEICLISQDNYYRARELQPIDDMGIKNFDTPNSIDYEQFAHDIRELLAGRTVSKLEYAFNNPEAKPEVLTFSPAPIIVVEGIFVFYYPEVASLLDLKIFIDAKEYIKLSRRIIRDRDERGYDLEDVLYRYDRHVAPTYEKYIAPFKSDADLVIPNNNHFKNAMDVLVVYLNNKLKNH